MMKIRNNSNIKISTLLCVKCKNPLWEISEYFEYKMCVDKKCKNHSLNPHRNWEEETNNSSWSLNFKTHVMNAVNKWCLLNEIKKL